MIRVLVTGAGALLGQGVLRALRQSSIPTHVIAVDPSPYAVGLYWADESHLIPLASDPTYLDVMKEILEKDRPDILMIGTDVELRVLAAHRMQLEKEFGTQILVSDSYVIEIADDKYVTASFLRERGFPFPLSALPGREEALIEKVGFPLVVKPRTGARSLGVHTVNDRAELREALLHGNDCVIQECVATPQEEYTAGVMCFPGESPVSIVMRRDLRDGNTYRAFVDDYPEYNAMCRKVAGALGVHGPVNFQFRVADGVPKIFEINARFSGTTPLRAQAGFNEVEMAIRHLVLGEPIAQPVPRKVAFLRYWNELMVDRDRLKQASDEHVHLDSDF